MTEHIFISHSTQDNATVKLLRQRLEDFGQLTWVDSRELRGGDSDINGLIEERIRSARLFLVVVSMDALDSDWVPWEIDIALETAEQREDGYKVIPIVLPGTRRNILKRFFPNNPLYIFVEEGPTGLDEAMPQIAAALGLELPDDLQMGGVVEAEPVEELLLRLKAPRIVEENEARRVQAEVELVYVPADGSDDIVSPPYLFRSPLGPLELDDIRWYIERYYQWPVGVFKDRAKKTEQELERWGQELYTSAIGGEFSREPLEAWQARDGSRRFSIQVDERALAGSGEEAEAMMREAASDLLSLPWEILHNGDRLAD